MEWVVTQQLHSKKILDKKLNEINASQRLSEARLDRQLRELGLDLTKIKRSSADLDDMHDLTPRPSGRRGSLPQLAGDNTTLKSLGAPHSPRSRRRLSISSIPSTPRDGHHASNSLNVTEHQRATRRRSIPNLSTSPGDHTQSIKSDRNNDGCLGAGKNKTIREQNELTSGVGTNKQTLPKIEVTKEADSSPVRRKSATAKFVHKEDGGVDVNDEISEAESRHLMGAAKGRRTRRSSEPAIGVQFLHPGQVNGCEARMHNSGDKGEFRQAIHHLPSNMVAEEDEEAGDHGGNCSDETIKAQRADTEAVPKAALNAGKTMKKKTSTAKGKDESSPKAGNTRTVGSPGQGYSRQRRKSEGDILRFAQIWTRQQEDLRNGRVKGQGAKHGYSLGVRDSSDDVWDSVRKCRYIRGYDPPEMIEPPDPNEYVFGHK
ncbi:unnamed protein product [Lymnaea stagnalis]|uniref:Uncharacterized protein n=1 Tax=Lymnaea stagnalis TaxID=6523 RepID=A0AAV2IEP3_LYMST